MNRPKIILLRTHAAKSLVATLLLAWAALWQPSSLAMAQTSEKLVPDNAERLIEGTSGSDNTLELSRADEADPEVADVTAYQEEARAAEKLLRLSSAGEYLTGDGLSFESEEMHLLGITVEDDWIKLEGGRLVNGIALGEVASGSPSAMAGLRGRRAAVQYLLDGIVVASAMLFPPALVGLPLLQENRIGESYDLIIGVDGDPIHDVMELEDHLRKLSPGEIVYFNILRGHRRWQVGVSLPATQTQSIP